MLYEEMLNEKRRIERAIQSIQARINKLPEGQLYCSSTGRYTKWFRNGQQGQVYIPKKQRKLAEKLALKKYLTIQLSDLKTEQRAIEFYLRHHDDNAGQKEISLFHSSAYNELLSPFFKPLSQELCEWANAPYEKNNKFPESLKHRAMSGNMVRSKSEEMIDMVLFKNKIPFRYECVLELGDILMYPDFTIRHPKTGELFYWEHFGLMDDSSYSKNAFSKLQLYAANGIIPTINLITTYENQEHPLSIDMVEETVKMYFL